MSSGVLAPQEAIQPDLQLQVAHWTMVVASLLGADMVGPHV